MNIFKKKLNLYDQRSVHPQQHGNQGQLLLLIIFEGGSAERSIEAESGAMNKTTSNKDVTSK